MVQTIDKFHKRKTDNYTKSELIKQFSCVMCPTMSCTVPLLLSLQSVFFLKGGQIDQEVGPDFWQIDKDS